MRPLLLDTCAVIWIAAGAEISELAEKALQDAASESAAIAISPISIWEIGLLVARGRLALSTSPRAWIATVLEQPGVTLAGMLPDMLLDSSFLPGEPPRDPADRIILATARAEGMRIVTRDRAMLSYAQAGHAEVIAC
ncbi:MAG TPA: type II toxin-antitoxin system VapC family toxin [Thermohalobaculum sp.]|nr:type II toxin-antitoxin system VapC family toxin [Thermohalobaculum sp.]